jgi:Ser/Thr protein kinase RdoA (MazF antagonist)
MSDSEIKSILETYYPFNNVSHLQILKEGVSNKNYVFSDGKQKYVARVCLFEPENQLKAMVPFLKYAENTGYPAARIIKTTNGSDYIKSYENPIIVTSYLQGDTANHIAIKTQHLASLAQLVANFHNLDWKPTNTPITLNPDYIFDVYDRIKDYRPTDKDADSIRLIELVDLYYKKFKETNFTELAKSLPQGITHGDINLGNVLLEGNKAISLLDFEEMGVSWQLQDIAMILVTWSFPNGEPNREFINTFLKEYELYRPLAKIEKENIVNATEFIAFRQCVYAKSMMSKGRMESAKDFSSYWTLLYLHEHKIELEL